MSDSSNFIMMHRVKTSGFSLIEAMVALVVLSIGLLGMAALYVTTIRSGTSSISRVQAVYLASDMADRIRANRNAQAAFGGAAATTVGCITAPCTPQAMAQNDLLVWHTDITNRLPGGNGTVGTDITTTPATYTIQISWTEPGASAQSYTLVTQL